MEEEFVAAFSELAIWTGEMAQRCDCLQIPLVVLLCFTEKVIAQVANQSHCTRFDMMTFADGEA